MKGLHLLTWEWRNIGDHMPMIAEYGWDWIQTSVVQPCKEFWDDNGRIEKYSPRWWEEWHKTWWKMYQVTDFGIGNHYGTKDDFIYMCEQAHKYGIKIVCDIVCRHVAIDSPSVNKELLQYIKPNQFEINNYHDRWQEINGMTGGLVMLDYNNTDLQNNHILPFLQELLQYCDGLRLDQMRHISLPSEGGTFFSNVIEQLPKDKFYYGEAIEISQPHLLKEYEQYMIPILKYEECWENKNRIAFCESHDTCLSFMYSLHMTPQQRINGYAECLKRYPHALYYARQDDSTIFSEQIKTLNNS